MNWEQGEELRRLRARDILGLLPKREKLLLDELEKQYKADRGIIDVPVHWDIDEIQESIKKRKKKK